MAETFVIPIQSMNNEAFSHVAQPVYGAASFIGASARARVPPHRV